MVSIPFDHLPSATNADPILHILKKPATNETRRDSFDTHLRKERPDEAAPSTENDHAADEATSTVPPSTAPTSDSESEQDQPHEEPAVTVLKEDQQPIDADVAEAEDGQLTAALSKPVAESLDTLKPESPSPKEAGIVKPQLSAQPVLKTADAIGADNDPLDFQPIREAVDVEILPQAKVDSSKPQSGEAPIHDIGSAIVRSVPANPAGASADEISATDQAPRVSTPSRLPITDRPRELGGPTPQSIPQQEIKLVADTVAPLDARDGLRGDVQRESERPADQSSEATSNKPVSSTTSPASRLPQHLFARGSAQTEASTPISPADQTRFIQRVARAFESAGLRNAEIRLRLSPPELGSLRLEIKMQGGAMNARIETDTTLARNILIDSLPMLRERLAEQGIRVEQFEVDVPDRQRNGLPNAPGDENHRDPPSHSSTTSTAQQVATDDSDSNNGRFPTAEGDEQLNVVI